MGTGNGHLLIAANATSSARKCKQIRAVPKLHPSSSFSSSSSTRYQRVTKVFAKRMMMMMLIMPKKQGGRVTKVSQGRPNGADSGRSTGGPKSDVAREDQKWKWQ